MAEEEEEGGRPGNELHAIWTKAAKEGGGASERQGKEGEIQRGKIGMREAVSFFPLYVRKSAREIPRAAVFPGPPPPFYFFQAVFPSPFSPPLLSLNGSAAREGETRTYFVQ